VVTRIYYEVSELQKGKQTENFKRDAKKTGEQLTRGYKKGHIKGVHNV
jgi:hypothetical protein